MSIVPNPEDAYNICRDYVPNCGHPLPAPKHTAQDDQPNVGYMGMDEDDILDREGLSPQQYLEFTERERIEEKKPVDTMVEPTFISTPGKNLKIVKVFIFIYFSLYLQYITDFLLIVIYVVHYSMLQVSKESVDHLENQEHLDHQDLREILAEMDSRAWMVTRVLLATF